jgi:hypothetical protein
VIVRAIAVETRAADNPIVSFMIGGEFEEMSTNQGGLFSLRFI